MLWCTKWEVRGGVLELCRHSSACGQWSASGTTAFPSRARAIPTESTGTRAGAGAAGPQNELCWAMGAVWWWVSRWINVLCFGSLLQENRCAVVPPVRSWQPSWTRAGGGCGVGRGVRGEHGPAQRGLYANAGRSPPEASGRQAPLLGSRAIANRLVLAS